VPLAFSIEASSDGFMREKRVFRVFEAFADGGCLTIQAAADDCAYRMWRLKRVSEPAVEPVTVAALSFAPEQPFMLKDPSIVLRNVERIISTFNMDSLSKALREAEQVDGH
jgi:hypothetical protein